MTCSNSVRRSPIATMTSTGNVWHFSGLARPGGAQARAGRGSCVPSHPVRSRALAGRLVLGHVEVAAAVEPLLLPKDVGGHRLEPTGR
jgi:hypothetical protein